jgi:hypothetical protein
MDAWDPCDTVNNFLESVCLRFELTVQNTLRRYLVTKFRKLKRYQTAKIGDKNVPVTNIGSVKESAPSSPSGNVSSGAVQNSNALGNTVSPQPQSAPTQGVPLASTQEQLRPGALAPVVSTGAGNSSTINFPSSNNFVLICFKVRRYLKRRWDLELNGITQDRELFEDFRKAYAANFRWAHRTFSLQSVQKIKFVKACKHTLVHTTPYDWRCSSSYGYGTKSTTSHTAYHQLQNTTTPSIPTPQTVHLRSTTNFLCTASLVP